MGLFPKLELNCWQESFELGKTILKAENNGSHNNPDSQIYILDEAKV